MTLPYVLSILAIMISLASAIATIVLWRMSGPRLKVHLSTVILVGDGARAALHLQVTNVGRASTIVQRWHLASRSSTAWISANSGWNQGPGTPKKLETHETVNWYLDYHEVRSKLLREHPSERHALQAVVTYGGGTARSKATSTISDSPSDSTPSLAKRVTMDFTDARVFAIFAGPIGATGRSDFSLVVKNCGLAPIRMTQVDLVTDEGEGQTLRAGSSGDFGCSLVAHGDSHWPGGHGRTMTGGQRCGSGCGGSLCLANTANCGWGHRPSTRRCRRC